MYLFLIKVALISVSIDWWFPKSFIFSTLISWHSTCKEQLSFLLIYLHQYGVMCSYFIHWVIISYYHYLPYIIVPYLVNGSPFKLACVSVHITFKEFVNFKDKGASLVAQWLRILLPMQRTRVRALVQEDPTCCGATRPVCHNCWACALEPTSHNYWSPRA